MMEKIKFDDGVRAYKVGGGVLRFNPRDPAVYQRFLEAADVLQAMEPRDAAAADDAIRAQLRRVFPGNDLDALFPGSLLALCENGKLLAVNFLEALEPVLLAGARQYAECKI